MKRKDDSERLDEVTALKLLLDGGELLTNANRIATISREDGRLMIHLQSQMIGGKSEYITLDKLNDVSLWYIKKFDFRKEMLARPNEWVGKKVLKGAEYYFGLNTTLMLVVGTSNEEMKKEPIEPSCNHRFYMHDIQDMEEI